MASLKMSLKEASQHPYAPEVVGHSKAGRTNSQHCVAVSLYHTKGFGVHIDETPAFCCYHIWRNFSKLTVKLLCTCMISWIYLKILQCFLVPGPYIKQDMGMPLKHDLCIHQGPFSLLPLEFILFSIYSAMFVKVPLVKGLCPSYNQVA